MAIAALALSVDSRSALCALISRYLLVMASQPRSSARTVHIFNAMFDIARRNFKSPSLLIWSLLFALTCGATPHQAVLGGLRGEEVNNNRLGAVASENKVCSQIGIDLLKAGGNAADAVSLASRVLGAMLTRVEARWHSALCWRHRQGLLRRSLGRYSLTAARFTS